jgi:hypothetical protein
MDRLILSKSGELAVSLGGVLGWILLIIFGPALLFLGAGLLFGGSVWIFGSASAAKERAKIQRTKNDEEALIKPIKEQADSERQEQLAALRAAVPPTPPERMRATIHLNDITVITMLGAPESGLFRKKVASGAYVVDVILEIPETERAVIQEQHLDRLVMETIPKYRNYEIHNLLGEFERTFSGLLHTMKKADHIAREVLKTKRRTYESYEAETMEIILADYFRNPYTRVFNTKPEANEYADKLKTVLLPKVRELLDKNVSRTTSQTIEF